MPLESEYTSPTAKYYGGEHNHKRMNKASSHTSSYLDFLRNRLLQSSSTMGPPMDPDRYHSRPDEYVHSSPCCCSPAETVSVASPLRWLVFSTSLARPSRGAERPFRKRWLWQCLRRRIRQFQQDWRPNGATAAWLYELRELPGKNNQREPNKAVPTPQQQFYCLNRQTQKHFHTYLQ